MADVTIPNTPLTRTEQYLAAANGQEVTLPTPMTREEIYLNEIATKMQGGGSSVTVEPLSVTANGEYTAPTGKAYSPVTVAVPDLTQYLSQIYLRRNKTPKSLTVDAKNAGYVCVQGFSADDDSDTNLEHITINNVDSSNVVSLYFLQCKGLRTITVNGGPIVQRNNQMFSLCTNLEEIDAELDFSRMTANSWYATFAQCRNLAEVRIVPSSIKLTVADNNFQGCTALSDDSIVSIANGLDGSATSLSISLPSAIKTRCGQIVGTVEDGVFTQDDTGSVTLTDFITQTKGWTLA